jgi:hypothetical protein
LTLPIPVFFVLAFSLFDFADEAKAAVGIPADLVVPPFAVVASNRFDEVQPPEAHVTLGHDVRSSPYGHRLDTRLAFHVTRLGELFD